MLTAFELLVHLSAIYLQDQDKEAKALANTPLSELIKVFAVTVLIDVLYIHLVILLYT